MTKNYFRLTAILTALVSILLLGAVSTIESNTTEPSYITFVTTKKTSVKEAPNKNSKTIGTIAKGTDVKVYGAINKDWFVVIYKNKPGYINRHQLKLKDNAVLGANRSSSNTSKNGSGISQPNPETIASDILLSVNKYRKSKGLCELKANYDFVSFANKRAQDISSSFSHSSPNGNSYNEMVYATNLNFNTMGENIGFGNMSGSEMVDYWLTSNGHRSLIENPGFTSTSIGIYIASDGTIYYVQEFIG